MRFRTRQFLMWLAASAALSACSLLDSSDSDSSVEACPALALCLDSSGCCPNQYCSDNLKVCLEKECHVDEDCGEGRTCDPKRYKCVEERCDVIPCPDEKKYCDPTTLRCLFGCKPESCREDQFCDESITPRACRPRGCGGDGDCDGDEYCRINPVEPPQYDPPVDEESERTRILVGACRNGCRIGEADACARGEFCDVRNRRCGQLKCPDGPDDCNPMRSLGPDPQCDPDTEICDQPVYCDPDSLKCRFGCVGELYAEEDPSPCDNAVTQYCSIDAPRRRCRSRVCTTDDDCTRDDTYCDVPMGQAAGICRRGCRPGKCEHPDREKCDVLTRECGFTGCDANGDCDDCLEKNECVGEAPHYCDVGPRQCRQGCRNNTDCEAGRSCDPATRTCVGDPCPNGNLDCLEGEYCDGDFGARRCNPGCRLDDSSTCPPLQPCRPSDHECGCDANPAVCHNGRRCVANSCVVQCDGESTCRPLGLVCDDVEEKCVPGCADDVFEDRQDPVISLDDLSAEDDVLMAEGLTLCGLDVDWYAVTVEAGQSLAARIEFEHPLGNLDLFLYSPNDDLEAELRIHCAPRPDGLRRCSRGFAGFEELRIAGATLPGLWKLAVRRFDLNAQVEEHARVPYLLDVAVGGVPLFCIEDALEQGVDGPNDERANGRLIDPGVFVGLRLCDVGVDWYVVFLAEGDILDVAIRFEHERGDLDLRLWPPDDSPHILLSDCDHLSCENPNVERLTLGPVPVSGLYPIEVWTELAGVPVTYQLDMAVERLGAGCVSTDDAVEPNNDIDTATPVEAGDWTGSVCPAGDRDLYVVTVPVQGAVRATLRYESDRGFPRLDLRLVTMEGFTLSSDAGAHPTKVVAAGGGVEPVQYIVRVVAGSDSSVGDYDLQIEIADPPPCDDDDQEENDTLAQAAVIEPGAGAPRQLCHFDEDWFRIEVGPLDDLELALDYSPEVAFSLQLLDLEGAPLPGCIDRLESAEPAERPECMSNDGDGSERLAVSDLDAGEYAVRIWPSNDGFESDAGQYHLNIDLVREPCDRDDRDLERDEFDQGEGNDTRQQAAVITEGTYRNLTLCRSDEDWYLVDVPAFQLLRVVVTFVAAGGDLDLSLHGDDGALLETCGDGASACIARADENADLFFNRNEGGPDLPVYVRVYGSGQDDPNGYGITIELDALGDPPE